MVTHVFHLKRMRERKISETQKKEENRVPFRSYGCYCDKREVNVKLSKFS